MKQIGSETFTPSTAEPLWVMPKQPTTYRIMINSFVFFFILLMTGCNQKRNISEDQNKVVAYFYSGQFQDKIDTFEILLRNRDSEVYSYKLRDLGQKKWNLELSIVLKDSNIIITDGEWNRNGEVFKIIDRKALKLYYNGNRYYFVYKILTYSSAVDSQGLIFWSPEFGIIIDRSLAWPSFARYEYLNDEQKNQIIRHLAYSTITDNQFYNEPDWEQKYKTKHNP